MEPVTGRSVRNSPLQTNHFWREDKESDNSVEWKGSKVCWKSSKSVEKRSLVKCKVKSEVKILKWSENVIQYKVQRSEIKWNEGNEAKWGGMRWSEVQYREWRGTSLYGKCL